MDRQALNHNPGSLNLRTKLVISFALLAIVSSATVLTAIYLIVRLWVVEAYQQSLLWNAILIFLVTIAVISLVSWFLGRHILAPLHTLIDGVRRVEAGDLDHRVQVKTQDETAILAEAFNSMNKRLRELVSELEKGIAEHTRDVDQRSNYLSASAEVSRVATTILEPDELIHRAVDLIRDSFRLYYVGLFLLDENREYAVLRAGTGDAGKTMVERGHRIRIGEGMIGWCIDHEQARVALEAGQDAVRLATPLLPATRSEAALPIRSRGHVVGAITVQSDQPGVFDEVITSVLQTMADQLGVALDNARLFTESERALENLRRSVGYINRQAWQESLQERVVLGYRGDASGIQPIGEDQPWSDEDASKLEEPESSGIQIPLKVRDQVLGIVQARKPVRDGEWTQDEIALMNVLVDQLGVALENARLYDESKQKAERERVLADITSRVRSSTDINVILQTAVQDLAEMLKVPKSSIRLINPITRSRGQDKETIPASEIPENGGSSDE